MVVCLKEKQFKTKCDYAATSCDLCFVKYWLECNEETLSKGTAQWLLATQLKQLSGICMY